MIIRSPFQRREQDPALGYRGEGSAGQSSITSPVFLSH